jgi:hypothetical protein
MRQPEAVLGARSIPTMKQSFWRASKSNASLPKYILNSPKMFSALCLFFPNSKKKREEGRQRQDGLVLVEAEEKDGSGRMAAARGLEQASCPEDVTSSGESA